MARTTTSTGLSLNDLALKMKQQDPKLSFKDAKAKAKEVNSAAERLEHGRGGKLKKKMLQVVFGKGVGSYISDKIRTRTDDEKAAQVLSAEHNKTEDLIAGTQKASSIPSTEIKAILQKLSKIEAKIDGIKSVRVAPESTSTEQKEPVKNEHYEDASLGLKALGYRKDEIAEMLKNAKGTSAADMIKSALKPKNAEAIPITKVMGAVEIAKQNVSAPPAPPQSVGPAPKEQPSMTKPTRERFKKPGGILNTVKKTALTALFGSRLGNVIHEKTQGDPKKIVDKMKDGKKKEDPKIKKILDKVTKIESVVVDTKPKVAPKTAPADMEKTPVVQTPQAISVAPEKIDVKKESDQIEARDAAAEKKAVDAASAETDYRKKILAELDEIKEKVSASPWAKILAIIGLIFALAKKAGDWLEKTFNLSGHINDIIDEIKKFFHIGNTYDSTAGDVKGADVKDKKNKQLEGTGYTYDGPGKFKDSQGNPVSYDSLPQDVREKVSTGLPGMAHMNDNDGVKPVVKPSKLAAVSAENQDLKASQQQTPIVVQAPAQKQAPAAAPAQASGDTSAIINVRNPEPSLGSYIGSIFNHPVVRQAM